MALRAVRWVGNWANKLRSTTLWCSCNCWELSLWCPYLGQLWVVASMLVDMRPPRLGPLIQGRHQSLMEQCNAGRACCWLSGTSAKGPTSLIKTCRRMDGLQCRANTLCHPEFAFPFFLSQTYMPKFRFPQQHPFRKKTPPFTSCAFLSKFPSCNSATVARVVFFKLLL